jgi:hypothetical protein
LTRPVDRYANALLDGGRSIFLNPNAQNLEWKETLRDMQWARKFLRSSINIKSRIAVLIRILQQTVRISTHLERAFSNPNNVLHSLSVDGWLPTIHLGSLLTMCDPSRRVLYIR